MAASSLTVLNDDFLTCNICFEIYKEPKILSYLHTFCKLCLQKHVQKEHSSRISCPLCREDTPLPTEGVCKLKHNFFIQNLIEFSESTSTQFKGRKCSFCNLIGKKNTAYSKCLTCRDFLCSECHKRHNFTTETINHEIATLEDLQSGKHHDKLRSQQNIPCPDHAAESLRYFCDTCNVSVCRDCVILNHHEHAILSPSDAIKKRREEIGGLLEALDKKAMAFKGKCTMLREQECKIDTTEQELSQLIEETVNKMVRKVRTEGKEAEEKLKSTLKFRREAIKRTRQKHDEKVKILDSAMDFCRKVISDGREGEIVFLQEMMRNRLFFLEGSVEMDGELPIWLPPSVQISNLVDSEALDLFRFQLKTGSQNAYDTARNLGTDPAYTDAEPTGTSLAFKATSSKSFSKSTSNLLVETSNEGTKFSTALRNQETKHCSINLRYRHTICCAIDTNTDDPKLTSIAWFDQDSFVVADEANGQVMHYNTSGKLLKCTAVKNVVTVACLRKVIYCGLRSGSIKMITEDLKVTDINVKGFGYHRPLVTLKSKSMLVAVGENDLQLVDTLTRNAKFLPIVNRNGHQINIDAKSPHRFQEDEIIVSDWLSNVVYFIKLDGKVRNVYRRYDKGSYWIPGGLTCDSKHNVYIADHSRNEVTIIDSKCNYVNTIKLKNVKNPRSMACSDNDELLITFKRGVAVFQISNL